MLYWLWKAVPHSVVSGYKCGERFEDVWNHLFIEGVCEGGNEHDEISPSVLDSGPWQTRLVAPPLFERLGVWGVYVWISVGMNLTLYIIYF